MGKAVRALPALPLSGTPRLSLFPFSFSLFLCLEGFHSSDVTCHVYASQM